MTVKARLITRLGALDVPSYSQTSAASVYHVVGEGVDQYIVSLDQWRALQTERGVCWVCGDQLPPDARFCISCRVEVRPPATGATERL